MLRRFCVQLGLCLILAAGLPALGAEAIQLPPLFTDNMVLQSQTKIKVKGTGVDNSLIEAKLAGKSYAAKTDEKGQFVLEMGPFEAGGPFELTFHYKGEAPCCTLKNVLVGEVWVCSGQSNMQMTVDSSADRDTVKSQSANSKIRLFTVPNRPANQPETSLKGKWVECNANTVGGFSAVGYHFGKKLNENTGLPVGLINCSWGGTYAEAWTKEGDLLASPTLEPIVLNYRRTFPGSLEKYKKDLDNHKKAIEKAKVENKKAPNGPQNPENNPNRPAVLFNGMITPLLHFPIKGAIWYQGESNAGQAYMYRTLFPAMIQSWRKAWGQADLPFYFVQLAPFMAISKDPQESNWAELREAQLLTSQNLPNTAMAVITDVGDEKDIHPRQKAPVGERLALWALKNQYAKSVQASGPVFKSLKIEGTKAILEFAQVGKGLEIKGDTLNGFTLAGMDKKFINAQAKIEGNRVIITAEGITEPVAVRYGWANFPVGNLWNRDGLPASPFRTDEFKGLTGPR
ncbi:MAG: sialate O-acetylesterase [Planctomycetota bacterium]|nr:sialate O-acetylesterase [Planctomycetota bacterium]